MLSLASKKFSAGILTAASFLNSAAQAELAPNLNVLPDISVNINETLEFIKSADFTARELLEKPSFELLSEVDKKLALELFHKFDPEMKDLLLAAMDIKVIEGKYYAVTQNDFKGNSFFHNLNHNCTREFHAKLEHLRKPILKSMMTEVCLFTELQQKNKSVCATSLVYDLYLNYPAEGLRLIGGLLSPEGEVELLKEGKKLVREPFSLLDDNSGRTITQKLIYSALMELANGDKYNYCNHCDQNYNRDTGDTRVGLFANEQLEMYRDIYNLSNKDSLLLTKPFIYGIDHLIKEYTPGTIVIGMRWNDAKAIDKYKHNKQPNLESTDNHTSSLISRAGKDSKVTIYHRVTVLEVKDKKVFFHNLHGNGNYPNGTKLLDPPRTVEDNKRGIQSMDYDEFMKRIDSFVIPLNGRRYPHPQYPKADK